MEEQDPGEFSGGAKVRPVDGGSTIAGAENKRLERRVERS